jgi:hypothetical protein
MDKARTEILRATAIQQVTDGYKQAVSVQEGSDGQGSITVQSAVKLQKPRSESMASIWHDMTNGQMPDLIRRLLSRQDPPRTSWIRFIRPSPAYAP